MSKHRRTPLGLGALLPITLLIAGCDAQGTDDRPETEAPLTDRPVEVATFSQWDEDGDQHLDSLEFVMWVQDENVFGDWVGEEGVDMEVFHDHLQTALDVNADGDIDERDWSIGIQRIFGDEDPGTWEEWDLDGDGTLDGAEFMQGAEHHGLHARVDQNGDQVITIRELQAFYFELFDRNGDGRIDSNEWNQGRATWLGQDDV
jgi:hypothetical protein